MVIIPELYYTIRELYARILFFGEAGDSGRVGGLRFEVRVDRS